MKLNYRRCISCRLVAPKNYFCRVVRVYPSQQVSLAGGNGRSAYICPQVDCLQKAQQKNRLGRALKVRVPEEIYQNLSTLLNQGE